MSRSTFNALIVAHLLSALLAGCGGQKIYHVSGTVTFKGKPVPTGQIVFEPDASAGNAGQAAFAKIKDGRYDTRLEGQGTLGGPHLVRIHGRDGVPRGELLSGMPLFKDYDTKVDLPKADAKQDFEVPANERG
jgi:hypothetical protein